MKQNFKENSKTAFSEKEIGNNLRSIFEFNYSIGETKLEIFKGGYEFLLHFQNSKEPTKKGFVIYEGDSYLNIEFDLSKFIEENNLHGNYDEFKIRFINALLEAGVHIENEYLLNIKEIEFAKKLYIPEWFKDHIRRIFDEMKIEEYSKVKRNDEWCFENTDYSLSLILSASEKTQYEDTISVLYKMKLKNANPIVYELGTNEQFFTWDQHKMSVLLAKHMNELISSLDVYGFADKILKLLDPSNDTYSKADELFKLGSDILLKSSMSRNAKLEEMIKHYHETNSELKDNLKDAVKELADNVRSMISEDKEGYRKDAVNVKSQQGVLKLFREQLFLKNLTAIGE
ncbi:hypothetical protein [Leptospira interrogans]|uniref:hypothetical protein n=1 Tax=Leptospira interrogans TaxID=173 RepID=UPI00077488E6|nr:hypothetical protein [Leptospira interrogans]